MSPEELQTRIAARVMELKLLAAWTALCNSRLHRLPCSVEATARPIPTSSSWSGSGGDGID
jgi:hypothetical protein